mmetsp:Transcript_67072/g.125319  ORF Transcript_67072/g.125319 Transcript_67072/m.125319 type:complete len:534 (-) Transcript_67072:96-1697(-)
MDTSANANWNNFGSTLSSTAERTNRRRLPLPLLLACPPFRGRPPLGLRVGRCPSAPPPPLAKDKDDDAPDELFAVFNLAPPPVVPFAFSAAACAASLAALAALAASLGGLPSPLCLLRSASTFIAAASASASLIKPASTISSQRSIARRATSSVASCSTSTLLSCSASTATARSSSAFALATPRPLASNSSWRLSRISSSKAAFLAKDSSRVASRAASISACRFAVSAFARLRSSKFSSTSANRSASTSAAFASCKLDASLACCRAMALESALSRASSAAAWAALRGSRKRITSVASPRTLQAAMAVLISAKLEMGTPPHSTKRHPFRRPMDSACPPSVTLATAPSGLTTIPSFFFKFSTPSIPFFDAAAVASAFMRTSMGMNLKNVTNSFRSTLPSLLVSMVRKSSWQRLAGMSKPRVPIAPSNSSSWISPLPSSSTWSNTAASLATAYKWRASLTLTRSGLRPYAGSYSMLAIASHRAWSIPAPRPHFWNKAGNASQPRSLPARHSARLWKQRRTCARSFGPSPTTPTSCW